MSSPSPPPAPDPYAVAAAQGAANKDTAIAQSELNMIGQKTPQGTLSYEQTGTSAKGTPQYTATTTLSPEQQRLYDLTTQGATRFGEIANTQLNTVADRLTQPFDMNAGRAAELADINRTFLDPQKDRERQAIEADLFNRGARPGSEAYTRAIGDFEKIWQDKYNQMFLGAYTTANQAALTERNQPLTEITSLLSGSQPQQPNFVSTPNTSIAPTDITGPVYSSYQGQLANWNANNQSRNAMMGAIMGIPSTIAGGWARGGFPIPSDRRVKTNIKRIGKTDGGLPVYTYRYKGGEATHMGVMAQDALKKQPDAVAPMGAILGVDYAKVA